MWMKWAMLLLITANIDSEDQNADPIIEHLGPFKDLKISSRIGNTPRYIELANNARFESKDNLNIDVLVQRWIKPSAGIAHRLEKNPKMVATSIFGVIAFLYVSVVFGIPLLSQQITAMLPTTVDQRIGNEGFSQIDNFFFLPTELEQETTDRIRQQFYQLIPTDSDRRYELLFRKGMPQIGANAFALPNGNIVITDQLIALADNDEMIISVLLHEIGHVEYRHSVQNMVQQASLASVILLLTGDVSTASSLVLLLPNVLIQSQYSQEFENEADDYALEQMLARNLDPIHFANIDGANVSAQAYGGRPTRLK